MLGPRENGRGPTKSGLTVVGLELGRRCSSVFMSPMTDSTMASNESPMVPMDGPAPTSSIRSV
jgi:hypothetical protein